MIMHPLDAALDAATIFSASTRSHTVSLPYLAPY